MTPEVIVQMYGVGMSATEIAREFGCSSHRIYSVLEHAGVERRSSGRRRFPPQMEDVIVARYRAGETYQQIADDLGCSTYVVARLAKAAGITPRMGGMKPGFWSEEQRRAISLRLRGENSIHWKGGRSTDSQGYVLVKVQDSDTIGEAMATKAGYVREHRLVMARHLGRPLRPNETVHHKNGDKADNRIENLELRVGGHGRGATHPHCATCTCFD